jgi:surface antigen
VFVDRFTTALKAIALSAVVVGSVSASLPSPSEAQTSCQCTQYVANRFSLRGFPNAGDWDNGFLRRNGFRQVSPRLGSVVVMERNFPRANTSFGHVGILEVSIKKIFQQSSITNTSISCASWKCL